MNSVAIIIVLGCNYPQSSLDAAVIDQGPAMAP